MAEYYTPLMASLLRSSVWGQPHATRIVWITLLAGSDQHGEWHGALPGLAREAQVSLEEVEQALEVLCAPDAYSRTTEHDGRRVEPLEDGSGWRVLNAREYRDRARKAGRREADRERKREQREAAKAAKPVRKKRARKRPTTPLPPPDPALAVCGVPAPSTRRSPRALDPTWAECVRLVDGHSALASVPGIHQAVSDWYVALLDKPERNFLWPSKEALDGHLGRLAANPGQAVAVIQRCTAEAWRSPQAALPPSQRQHTTLPDEPDRNAPEL
jgi:hypothetical protein